jgi:hypothetical protein
MRLQQKWIPVLRDMRRCKRAYPALFEHDLFGKPVPLFRIML